MPPAGFEPAIPASEWPQTHALDRAATGIADALKVIIATETLQPSQQDLCRLYKKKRGGLHSRTFLYRASVVTK
jgi:hypothetical protein